MRSWLLLLITCIATIPNCAFADNPESLRIGRQLYNLNYLILACEEAKALRIEGRTEGSSIEDWLAEVLVAAYEDFADLSESEATAHWPSNLTKAEWGERLIRHYVDHVASVSANERWTPAIRRICLAQRESVVGLFKHLSKEQQERLLEPLQSAIGREKLKEGKRLAKQLRKK